MSEILIRRYQDLVTIRSARSSNAPAKTRPAPLEGGVTSCPARCLRKGTGTPLIEQYSQAIVSFRSRVS